MSTPHPAVKIAPIRALDANEDKKVDSNDFIDVDHIRSCQEVYVEIVRPYPLALAKAASKKERETKKIMKNPNFVYGELTIETLGIVFSKIKNIYGKPNVGCSGIEGFLQTRGGTFYDLGSGSGKMVVAAAVLHNFDVCCGIELLEGLYSISFDVLATYNSKGKAHPFLSGREFDTHCQSILGDFLDTEVKDWRDGDIVYINATSFTDKMLDDISAIAVGMKKGSFIISTTSRLPVADFDVLEFEMMPVSWGDSTIFIMQKTTEPRSVRLEEDG